MTEIDDDLVYLHKKSLKKNYKTYLCPDCVNQDQKKNLESVHYQAKGLDIECFVCKLPGLE